MKAFLKHLLKNISAILTICDDVSILRFSYMLRYNPEHNVSGGRDRSIYTQSHNKSDQPGLHVFRWFLGQLSTDFHEIL